MALTDSGWNRDDREALGSLAGVIRAGSDRLVVLRRVVDQALALIPAADGAAVELADAGQKAYVCAVGSLAEHAGTRLGMRQSLSGLAYRMGETLWCEDCEADPRVDREACRKVGAVSMVCVPLCRGTDPFGVLKVSSVTPRAFTSRDVAALTRLAGFISATVGATSEISRAVGELFRDEALPAASGCGADEVGPRMSWNGDADPGIAEFVASVLAPGTIADLAVRRRVERVLAESSFTLVFQPIVDLVDGGLLGVEALSRFAGPPRKPPHVWFSEAAQVGLGVPLQLAVVKTALKQVEAVPGDAFLAINLGPDAIMAAELPAMLKSVRCDRVVIELTEHLKIDDYPRLRAALAVLRDLGARLAVDDIGAGFASLGHIVNLAPDLIKLDRQFTRGIDLDPARRAVARALVSLASDTGAGAVAEGVETEAELDTVRRLGIRDGQGYLISRPTRLASIPVQFLHVADYAAVPLALTQGVDRRVRPHGR